MGGGGTGYMVGGGRRAVVALAIWDWAVGGGRWAVDGNCMVCGIETLWHSGIALVRHCHVPCLAPL